MAKLVNAAGTAPSCELREFIRTHTGGSWLSGAVTHLVTDQQSLFTPWDGNIVDVVQILVRRRSIAQLTVILIVDAGGGTTIPLVHAGGARQVSRLLDAHRQVSWDLLQLNIDSHHVGVTLTLRGRDPTVGFVHVGLRRNSCSGRSNWRCWIGTQTAHSGLLRSWLSWPRQDGHGSPHGSHLGSPWI